MSGRLIDLMKMTDFDGSSNGANSSQVTWVAENMSIVEWREALVIVCWFSLNATSG